MKFSSVAVALAALCAVTVEAFSAVAPPSKTKTAAKGGGGAPNLDPVDKTMKGLDDETVFDPTSGSSAALTRNNKGEVWVPQVGDVQK